MTRPFFNIVSTRVPGRDWVAARRWYVDHVAQLLAFDGLQSAWLMQRVRPDAALSADPSVDFLCLYEFGTAGAFAGYEASQIHAAAAADRELSWGRDGIMILQRRQYLRWFHMRGAAADLGATSYTPWDIVVFEAPGGDRLDPASVMRALAADAERRGIRHCLAFAAIQSDGVLWLEAPSADSHEQRAHPSNLRLAWQARFETVRQWAR